jgi:hypothetical protein
MAMFISQVTRMSNPRFKYGMQSKVYRKVTKRWFDFSVQNQCAIIRHTPIQDAFLQGVRKVTYQKQHCMSPPYFGTNLFPDDRGTFQVTIYISTTFGPESKPLALRTSLERPDSLMKTQNLLIIFDRIGR